MSVKLKVYLVYCALSAFVAIPVILIFLSIMIIGLPLLVKPWASLSNLCYSMISMMRRLVEWRTMTALSYAKTLNSSFEIVK